MAWPAVSHFPPHSSVNYVLGQRLPSTCSRPRAPMRLPTVSLLWARWKHELLLWAVTRCTRLCIVCVICLGPETTAQGRPDALGHALSNDRRPCPTDRCSGCRELITDPWLASNPPAVTLPCPLPHINNLSCIQQLVSSLIPIHHNCHHDEGAAAPAHPERLRGPRQAPERDGRQPRPPRDVLRRHRPRRRAVLQLRGREVIRQP